MLVLKVYKKWPISEEETKNYHLMIKTPKTANPIPTAFSNTDSLAINLTLFKNMFISILKEKNRIIDILFIYLTNVRRL